MRNGQLQREYLRYGLTSFEDEEVLEFLLSIQFDSLDHRREAQEFIHKYGSLNNVIDSAANGNGNHDLSLKEYQLGLRLPHDLATRYLRNRVTESPLLGSPQVVIDYLSHSMNGLKVEHFKVLYLNGRNGLIHDEDISKGTVGHTAVYPREVVRSALEYQASGLIFAHNHSSGNPQPSEDDIEMTKKLRAAASLFDITVHDHIIVAGGKYYSFSEKGMLEKG
ncbi:MAG: DNA repair protein RadC [Candidatus Marinimicrobia bacterium]|nr:DNA repair protein RadC [Candidatus Neomarinimicrobiota bacterium]